MTSPDESDDFEPDRDYLELLAGYVNRMNAGEPIAPEEVQRDASTRDDLVRDWRIFLRLGDVLSPRKEPVEPGEPFGDFLLDRVIGRGGMAVVHEAWQISLGRRVAIKLLPGYHVGTELSQARLLREARAIARLDHPNIVTVYATGVENGMPFMAMELVDGETLDRVLARCASVDAGSPEAAWEKRKAIIASAFRGRTGACAARTQPVGDREYFRSVANTFVRVAEGLDSAHAAGIIHRDIKPSNLIVDARGAVRILDFGLARIEGEASLTESAQLVGTPRYMSPEQADASDVDSVDHRADVYSLGAVIYEILAGRPWTRGRTNSEILSEICHRDPISLRRINPRVPRDLETIVLKCLRKSREDRYGTAEALAQDLRRFGRGDPIEARPEQPLERLFRRARRKSLLLAALGLLVVIGVLSSVLLARSRRDALLSRKETYRETILRAIASREQARPARGPSGVFARWVEESEKRPTPDLAHGSGRDPIEEAARELERAIALVPHDPSGHYQLALCQAALGRRGDAEMSLARALGCAPGFIPAILERERLRQGAKEEGEGGLSLRPANVLPGGPDWETAYLEAVSARSAGDWRLAIDAYSRLIERSERDPEPFLGFSLTVWLGRGRCRLAEGDTEGAIWDFHSARVLWPELPEPALLLGTAYLERGDTATAERVFLEYHRGARRPDEFALAVADLYHLVYRHLHSLGLEWADRAGETARREALRSWILANLERGDEARDAAERSVQLDPERSEGHRALAVALERDGKLEEAEAAYRRAVACDPVGTSEHGFLGWFLHARGRLDEAETALRRAIACNPEDPTWHSALGRLLKDVGRMDDADAAFRAAEECCRAAVLRDPRDRIALQDLGYVLLSQVRVDEAETVWRQLREHARGHPLAPAELTRVLIQTGKHGEAARELLRSRSQGRAIDCRLAAELLRWGKREDLVEHAADLMDAVRAVALGSPAPPLESLSALSLAYLIPGPTRDVEVALRWAYERQRRAGAGDPWVPLIVSEVEAEAGQRERAVRTLESAVRRPGTTRHHDLVLREARAASWPRLASTESVDAFLDGPWRAFVVPAGAGWRFTRERPASAGREWTERGFDDTTWEEGRSGIGIPLPGRRLRPVRSVLLPGGKSITIVYLRHVFRMEDPSVVARLWFTGYVDGGCVAYLNGREIATVNAEFDGSAPFEARALGRPPGWIPLEMEVDTAGLLVGENVLAVIGVNAPGAVPFFEPILEVEYLDSPDLRSQLLSDCVGATRSAAPGVAAYLEGRVLERDGREVEASRAFEAAIAAAPEDPLPRRRLEAITAAAEAETATEGRATPPPTPIDPPAPERG